MNTITIPAQPRLPYPERQRRREAVAAAVRSNKIEGIDETALSKELSRRFIEGEISIEDWIGALNAKNSGPKAA